MAVLNWQDPNEDGSLLIGFVGDATNEAFRLDVTEKRLESNITDKELSYAIEGADDAAVTAAGKAKAEALLVENNIPEKTTLGIDLPAEEGGEGK